VQLAAFPVPTTVVGVAASAALPSAGTPALHLPSRLPAFQGPTAVPPPMPSMPPVPDPAPPPGDEAPALPEPPPFAELPPVPVLAPVPDPPPSLVLPPVSDLPAREPEPSPEHPMRKTKGLVTSSRFTGSSPNLSR